MSSQNDRARWLQGPSAACAVLPASLDKPWRLVLLGAPGCGKGTQADFLVKRMGACHLSTGDVFRAAAKQCECDQSPAMQAAQQHIRKGELVPDTTVWDMVRERGACLGCGGGFILDGFPRTVPQAESLQGYMKEAGLALSAVVNYELPSKEIIRRLSGRRTCRQCRAVFHVSTYGEAACNRCGGELYQREDDRAEAIAVRLETYAKSTAPLIDFYRKLGLLVSVSAEGSPEEIYQRTIAALEK